MDRPLAKKAAIIMGYRHTVESPRRHYPEAELWGQSNAIRSWDWALMDWSRWFDIHTIGPQAHYAGIQLLRPDILAWYQKQGSERPIYFAEDVQGVPAAKRYPLEAVCDHVGVGAERFGCQMDYMMALAMLEGFERIIFYGCGEPYVKDPNSPEARKWFQRHSSVFYWMGRAEERGIELLFDGPCINRPFDGKYGYDMGPKGLDKWKNDAE